MEVWLLYKKIKLNQVDVTKFPKGVKHKQHNQHKRKQKKVDMTFIIDLVTIIAVAKIIIYKRHCSSVNMKT